jgi:hypothetical protein
MDGDGRGFSVEMISKEHVRTISVSDKGREGVLFEGVLGELENLEMLEGSVLSVRGSHGTLMVDLTEEELRGLLTKKKGSD